MITFLQNFLLFLLHLFYDIIGSYGISILLISVVVSLILWPFKYCVSLLSYKSKAILKQMQPYVDKIMALDEPKSKKQELRDALYKHFGYSPLYTFLDILPLTIQLPFLIAMYHMIVDNQALLAGHSFLFLSDLSKPDGLLFGLNLLPILMTSINILAAYIMPDSTKKSLIQASFLAVVFFVLLYMCPSAAVLYWTFNNILILVKYFIKKRNTNIAPMSFFELRAYWRVLQDKKFVIFSEGNRYKYSTDALLKHLSDITVNYITIDPKDILLYNPPTNVKPILMKMNLGGLLFLKWIECDLMVSTTPGLESLAWKKSPFVKHYSYFLHAPFDMGGYQKYSFDYFDSVVCSSEFQVKSLRALEKKRGTKEKDLPVLGVPYYDTLLAEYNASEKNMDDNTVLIAPSWGKNNFLNYINYDITDKLMSAGYKVILRPHPQSLQHKESSIVNIIRKHEKNINFILDVETSSVRSFAHSSFMVSGYSGVIADYVFLTSNPVIIFTYDRTGNDISDFYEESDLDSVYDKEFFEKIGIVLNTDDDLIEKIKKIDSQKLKIIINEERSKVANFGCCSAEIAEYWKKILK